MGREIDAMVTQRQEAVPSRAKATVLANNLPANKPMMEPAPQELDHFAQALLDNATRLALASEPPLEKAEVLIEASNIHRWVGSDETAQALLTEAHQSILQIDPVAVRIKKLGELAGHYWANYQDRGTAISLLEDAEQLLLLLPDVFEDQHYAISEITFRYGLLGEADKAVSLLKNLPEPFSRHVLQESIIHDQIYSQVEQGTPADQLLEALDSLDRPYSKLDAITTTDCCDEGCCEPIPGDESPSPQTAASKAEQLMELEVIARRYGQAGQIDEVEVVLEEFQALLEQLPLGHNRLNFQLSLASFFQHDLEDRKRWSTSLENAVATYQELRSTSDGQPKQSFLLYQLMQLTTMLRELDRTEEAIALLQPPVFEKESAADKIDRWLMLATAYGELDQTEAALETLNQAARLSQSDAIIWDYPTDQTWRQIQVAGEYIALQQPQTAWQILEPIVQRAPHQQDEEYISQEDLWTLFDYLVQLGKTNEAIALARSTDLEDRLTDLISTLARQGDVDAAIALVSTLEDPHTAAEAWTYIAAGYSAQGQLDLAEQALEKTWAIIQTMQAEGPSETDQEVRMRSLEYIAGLYYNSSRAKQMEAQVVQLKTPVLRAAFIQALLQYQAGDAEISPAILDLQLKTLRQIPLAQRSQFASLALMRRYAARQDYGKAIAIAAALDHGPRQASNLVRLLEIYIEQPQPALDVDALEQQLQAL